MAERLSKYRSKRDFAKTAEPSGEDAGAGRRDLPRFVVQEHHARRLHWDLRLEHDGVAMSWAVPKGIPPDPKENHLAVRTEDHPLEYLEFEGDIPKGEYGAGSMRIWDRGTYETHKFRDDEVMVTFHGERVRGRHVLFRTRGDDWMIHRMDPAEGPPREPMPEHLAPMLARLGELPPDQESYGYEIKWDGVRAILYSTPGDLRLESRRGNDITPRYPELRGINRALSSHQAVLDGEVVAYDAEGRPSFERLQGRMHLASESAVRRRMKEAPVAYVAFDLLYLDGHSTCALPYAERRELLEGLELDGPHWQTPDYHSGEGAALLEAARAQGLEGVVAKRLDSTYEPGRRTGAWIKVKNRRRQEVVVGGWLAGEGARHGRLGALLVGVYDLTAAQAEERGTAQRLTYVGRVGSGYNEEDLARLGRLLDDLASDKSPFEGRRPPKEARFVEPRLVAEVEFAEWTRTKTLRAPVFKGLRDDKDPSEVIAEEAAGPSETSEEEPEDGG